MICWQFWGDLFFGVVFFYGLGDVRAGSCKILGPWKEVNRLDVWFFEA